MNRWPPTEHLEIPLFILRILLLRNLCHPLTLRCSVQFSSSLGFEFESSVYLFTGCVSFPECTRIVLEMGGKEQTKQTHRIANKMFNCRAFLLFALLGYVVTCNPQEQQPQQQQQEFFFMWSCICLIWISVDVLILLFLVVVISWPFFSSHLIHSFIHFNPRATPSSPNRHLDYSTNVIDHLHTSCQRHEHHAGFTPPPQPPQPPMRTIVLPSSKIAKPGFVYWGNRVWGRKEEGGEETRL